jgi:hypothetical protein
MRQRDRAKAVQVLDLLLAFSPTARNGCNAIFATATATGVLSMRCTTSATSTASGATAPAIICETRCPGASNWFLSTTTVRISGNCAW